MGNPGLPRTFLENGSIEHEERHRLLLSTVGAKSAAARRANRHFSAGISNEAAYSRISGVDYFCAT